MEEGRPRTEALDDDLPVEVAGWLAAGAGVLAATRAADSWSPRRRQAVLGALDQVAGVVTAARARVLTAERDAGTWAFKGDRDFASWVGRTSRQGRGSGFAQAGQAATLAAMPTVEQALVDGPVTAGHVQQLTRATAASPSLAAELATPEGQAQVVHLAGRLDATRFGRELAHRAARLDPASRQRAHDQQRASRFLHLTHTSGGTLVKGQLDAVAGNLVQRAIDALNPRPPADDTRDHGQRQADALTAMSRRILADPTTTPGSVAPPQVTLLVHEDTWAALRARGVGAGVVGSTAGAATNGGATAGGATADGARASGAGMPGAGIPGARVPGAGSAADVTTRLRGVAPVADEDGNVWPASEVARVLCDDQISRVVLGTKGVVLDEGRSTRLFSPAQRLAMIARDGGGCAYPGCHLPARYTELHHLTWWDRDNGPTDTGNGCQQCSYHHHEIHRRDIRITRNDHGQYVFRYPDGTLVPGSAPPDPPPGEADPRPADERLPLRTA